MNVMSAPPVEPADLLDLKLLPEWRKEPGATKHYDHYTGEDAPTERRTRERGARHEDRAFRSRERPGRTRPPRPKPDKRDRGRMPKTEGTTRRDSGRSKNGRPSDRVAPPASKPFEGTIR